MLKAFDHQLTEEGDIFLMPPRLDSSTYMDWFDQILSLTQSMHGKVILDLKHTTYISSVFIRFCLQMNRNLGNNRLMMRNANPSIARIFMLAKLEGLLETNG